MSIYLRSLKRVKRIDPIDLSDKFHLYHGSESVIEGIKKTEYTLSRSDTMSTLLTAALYDKPTQTISEDLAREKAREVAAVVASLPEDLGGVTSESHVIKGLQSFRISNTDQFIAIAKSVHNNKYDYSKSSFITQNTITQIVCPEHGEFHQRPGSHMRGSQCPKCAIVTSVAKLKGIPRPSRNDISCSREQRLLSYQRNSGSEAEGQAILQQALGKSYFLTPEFCHADGAYGESSAKVYPVQVKTAHADGKNHFRFNKCNQYEAMILVCVPLESRITQVLIMPGKAAKKTIAYTPGGKYEKFVVNLGDIELVMQRILVAINEARHSILPSGHTIDLSSIQCSHFEGLCMPKQKLQAKAQQNVLKRQARLPKFKYDFPSVQHGPVDIHINDLRVQDKQASFANAERSLNINISKMAGRVLGKSTSQPYHEKDFDILWVFTPFEYDYVIPMQQLVKHKMVMQKDGTQGKITLSISINLNHWTDSYKIFHGSENEISQVLTIFREACGGTTGDQ